MRVPTAKSKPLLKKVKEAQNLGEPEKVRVAKQFLYRSRLTCVIQLLSDSCRVARFKLTPLNLDFISNLESSIGQHAVDADLVAMLPNTHRICIYLRDDSWYEFFFECSDDVLWAHFRAVAERCGFGGRSLMNLVHAEVMQTAQREAVAARSVVVLMSQECFQRTKPFAEHYTYYDYDLRVSDKLSGVSFSVMPAQRCSR